MNLTPADRELADSIARANPLERGKFGRVATGNHLVAQNDEREPIFGCVLSGTHHKLSRERAGGSGLDGSITPVCSCGWKGRAEYAHNDYQYTNLREQEQAHMGSAR